MRNINQEGLDLICKFEGFSSNIYICPAGYPTIGYGHVVKEYERKKFKNGISEATALQLLQTDAQIAQQAVLRLITIPLTDSQFNALVSFTYNLGAGALQRSTLRRKVNANDHEDVPQEFKKWVWAGGRKLEGLIKRRNFEAAMYSQNLLGNGQ